ncbi:hypothetical protein BDV40DRAFT_212283 [Aspergillus tamarii]|uniref:Uncharacterized protein n=1 Tax=Aspergillus tamarii TaxID=41984 RepID=A0A5N6UPG5_ASPTM|nr:hypothetical protein BDV40DRAFT_212283 [Aspergillus tamarii]
MFVAAMMESWVRRLFKTPKKWPRSSRAPIRHREISQYKNRSDTWWTPNTSSIRMYIHSSSKFNWIVDNYFRCTMTHGALVPISGKKRLGLGGRSINQFTFGPDNHSGRFINIIIT